MNIIRPIQITNSNFTSSDVPETDYSAWSAATTYALGNRCIVVVTHTIYEALQSGINHYPPDTTGGTTPYWMEIGATNRWKMFDSKVGTQTAKATSFTVTLTPGLINAIALMEVDAGSVTVTMHDPSDGLVYSRTIVMNSNAALTDWYAYFFDPIFKKTYLVLLDLPSYRNASITVTFSSPGGTASCGVLVVGLAKALGETKWAPQVSILDYSRKENDAFGNPTLVVRNYAKLLSCDLEIFSNTVDDIQRLLAGFRATPLVWVGSTLYESTIVYGFYRSFNIVISGLVLSDCTLEIEGLV